METKSKFLAVYAAIAVVAVGALGSGYETYTLKQKVDKVHVTTVEEQVASATADSANAYFQQNQTDAKATAVKCVKTAQPTKFTCVVSLVQPSTGKTASSKYTVTWTKSAGMTNIVAAK